MDNIEKQLNSKVDGLYVSLEKILKVELQKCVKEIQDNIDLEIGALKLRLDQLKEKINSNNSSSPNKYDPDVTIVIMGLPYHEDLAQKVKEVFEDGCACEQILTPVAMQRLRARGPGPGVVKVAFASVREKVAVLRGKHELTDYTWFGNNRNKHIRAPQGSGGVGLLVKNELFECYKINVDKSVDGIIGVRFEHRELQYSFVIFSCYLSPERSVRGRD